VYLITYTLVNRFGGNFGRFNEKKKKQYMHIKTILHNNITIFNNILYCRTKNIYSPTGYIIIIIKNDFSK